MNDIPAELSIELKDGLVLRNVTVFAGKVFAKDGDIYNPVVIYAASNGVGVKISFASQTAARDLARQILQTLGDTK